MEVKSKMKIITFAISAAFLVFALLFFFLAPMIAAEVAEIYSGATALLGGAKTLFSFAFDNGNYLIFFIVFALFIFCYIWWLIVIIIRKSWKSFIWFGVSLLLVVANAFSLCALLINVEGSASVVKQVFAIDGALIGKAFVAASIAMFFFGVIFVTLCAYSDILQALEARAKERSAEEEEIRQMAREEAQEVYDAKRNEILKEDAEMSVYDDKLNLKRHREDSNDEYYENLINELPMFRKRRGEQPVEKKVVVVERVVEQPKPEPKPEPKVEAKVEPKPAPVVAPAPAAEPFERISFSERLSKADKVLKEHYNELKSEVLSYGIKSRVSNSGDTFRLHTKTYVKMVVAGKALKLYLALDPKDYKDSTLPISDASNKGLYKDIPLVFKVKSDLSVRRAKQLIADAAAKDGLVQGEVEAHNWAKELK